MAYQTENTPADPRHSSRLGLRQRFYVVEVLVGLQVGAFLTKVVVVIWFLMLIRWTLPRFRYDQAMRLGWLALFPLSVLNILVTGLVLLAVGKP